MQNWDHASECFHCDTEMHEVPRVEIQNVCAVSDMPEANNAQLLA